MKAENSLVKMRSGARMSTFMGLSMLAALGTLWGCATPAQPQKHPESLAAIRQRSDPRTVEPLDGVYDVEFISRFFGPIRTRFTAQALTAEGPHDPVVSFKANTRPGVAWNLVGGFTGAMGRIFAPFIFPQGMLLIWTSNLPEPANTSLLGPGQIQKPGLGGIGPSTLSKWQAHTLFRGPEQPVEIRFEDSQTIALMKLTKLSALQAAEPFSRPDYQQLITEYEKLFRLHFLDPAVASSPDAALLAVDMRDAAAHAQDDLEFLFGCALGWRNHPALPIPAIYRKPDHAACDALFASVSQEQTPIVVKCDAITGIVTMEVIAFLDCAQVDAAFNKALALRPTGLVLDVRNCPGLETAAFRAACWLVKRPCDAGTLVGPSRRAAIFQNEKSGSLIQRQLAAEAAPLTTIRDGADLTQLDVALNLQDCARIRIEPCDEAFQGPVCVLTSRRTFSSAEMLAEILQFTGRATIIGGKTGKRANLGRDYEIPGVEGWVCRIPSFDYLAPGGAILSQRGVIPDKDVPREEAAKVATQLLQPRP